MSTARWATGQVLVVVLLALGLLGMHGLSSPQGPLAADVGTVHAGMQHDAPAPDAATPTDSVTPTDAAAAPSPAGCHDRTTCVATLRPVDPTPSPAAVVTAVVEAASSPATVAPSPDATPRAPPDRVDLVALGISRT